LMSLRYCFIDCTMSAYGRFHIYSQMSEIIKQSSRDH